MAVDRNRFPHAGQLQQNRKQSAGQPAASAETLEDEIRRLRRRMEQAYLAEDSLHSDRVIEASRKLDKKINEYMRYKRRWWNG